jgi:hypothetical protein
MFLENSIFVLVQEIPMDFSEDISLSIVYFNDFLKIFHKKQN